jgi:hypothetical protein
LAAIFPWAFTAETGVIVRRVLLIAVSPWERLNKNSLPEIIGHFLPDSRGSSDPLLTFIHHGSEPFQA